MDLLSAYFSLLFMICILTVIMTEIIVPRHEAADQYISFQDGFNVFRSLSRKHLLLEPDWFVSADHVDDGFVFDNAQTFNQIEYVIKAMTSDVSYEMMLAKVLEYYDREEVSENVLSVLSDDELGMINGMVTDFASEHNLIARPVCRSSSAMIEVSDDSYIDFDANRIWTINQPETWIMDEEGVGMSNSGYYPLKMLVSLTTMDDQIVGFKDTRTLSMDSGQYQHRIHRRNVVFFDDNHLRYDLAHLSHGSYPNVASDDHKVLVITIWVSWRGN